MRLEGTLDAFGLTDIFQLLAYTRKTGALLLRQDGRTGVVHVRDGAVSAASSDVTRQQVVRRLIGAGLVRADDVRGAEAGAPSLLRTLVAAGRVDAEAATAAARDQAIDSVFDLLRWTEGEFSFVIDQPDPDELDLALPVEEVVAEAHRRREQWDQAAGALPAPADVLRPVAAPPDDIRLGVEEWSLLTLVDGRRTVRDLVDLVGRGEYWTASRLGALVERGLLVVSQDGDGDPVVAALDELVVREGGAPVGVPDRADKPAASPLQQDARPSPVDRVQRDDRPVVPPRGDAIIPRRIPDYPEPDLVGRHAALLTPVEGTAAIQPLLDEHEHEHDHGHAPGPAPDGAIGRDPSINTSLLLRLIAGVRGL